MSSVFTLDLRVQRREPRKGVVNVAANGLVVRQPGKDRHRRHRVGIAQYVDEHRLFGGKGLLENAGNLSRVFQAKSPHATGLGNGGMINR